MRYFLKGKKVWGYVNGTSMKPRNTNEGYIALILTSQTMQKILL